MAREHRIISALVDTPVPVPTTFALCTDTEVNGAPFYVMSYVDGVVLDSPEKGAALPSGVRREVAFHLVDVLAELHLVDVDAVGLGDLAKRTGYVERQLKRWSAQWRDSKTPRAAGHRGGRGRAAGPDPRRSRRSPSPTGTTASATAWSTPPPVRVAAVLDWELCTLGDPLADVGYLRVYWTDPGDHASRPNDPTGAGGFPSYGELLARYEARTGFDLSGIDYYVAFSSWRLAVISEGVYARYLHGAMADDGADIDAFRIGTEELAERALAAVRRLGT